MGAKRPKLLLPKADCKQSTLRNSQQCVKEIPTDTCFLEKKSLCITETVAMSELSRVHDSPFAIRV